MLAIALLVVLFLSLPQYLRKALIYRKANIDDYTIFENRVVKAGNYREWNISNRYNKKNIPAECKPVFEKYHTVAFIVTQNDSLLHEEYWEGYSDSSVSNSFSMAKSIIGLLVGIALEEKKIESPDQHVTDFFPELKGAFKDKLRIINLLTMTSGIEWDESYSSAFSKTTMSYYGDDIRSLIMKLPVSKEPGKTYIYQSCDTELLAMILEKATGISLSEYASEKLWKPLGARYDALWSLDHKDGMEKAYCCFNSNARDFARFGKLILDSGKCNGIQVVPWQYLAGSLKPLKFIKDEYGNMVDYYGYQWWIMNYKGFYIPFARGLNGQYILVIPDKKAIIVRLGKERSKNSVNLQPDDLYTYIDAALSILN